MRWATTPPLVEQLGNAGASQYWFTQPYRRRRRLLTRLRLWRQCPWLDEECPDLVVISLSRHFEGCEIAEEVHHLDIPYVLIVQSVSESGWPGGTLAAQMRAMYECARKCYILNHKNRELIEVQIGMHLENCEIVRNPFNVAYEANPRWPNSRGQFRFACVGRLEPSAKGQDLALQVLATDKWRERNWRLTFVGTGGDEEVLRRLVDLYHLHDFVEFAGFQPDIEKVWGSHHALILPSRYEGLPLALVEAMLCGRPCIVTDVAGHAEVVDDGRTGFIAAAPTVRLLDEAMERAWQRRDEWQEIGQHAAESIKSKVPEDPVADFAAKLYALAASFAKKSGIAQSSAESPSI